MRFFRKITKFVPQKAIKNMKYKILAALVVFVFIALNLNSGASSLKSAFKKWVDTPLDDLSELADKFFFENVLDSSLIYYSAVVNRYNKNMKKEDAEICAGAMNNIGYIMFFTYKDYVQSYSYLLRGLELCDKYQLTGQYPYIYLNLGNIYITYHDYANAKPLYEKAISTALETDNYSLFITSFSNLLLSASAENDIESISKILDTFSKTDLPDIEMAGYTRNLYKGAVAIKEKRYEEALSCFEKAIESIDAKLYPERYVAEVSYLMSDTYMAMGDNGKTVDVLKQAERLMKEKGHDDMRIDIYDELAIRYGQLGMADSATLYNVRRLQLEDSLFNKQRFDAVKDVKFMYDINRMNEAMHAMTREKRMQTIILSIVISGAVIIFALLLWSWRQNRKLRRSNMDLFRKNQEIITADEIRRQQREIYEKQLQRYKQAENSDDRTEEDNEDELPADGNGKTIDDEKQNELLDRINKVMETVPDIFEPDFSIEKCAALAGTKAKNVSATINNVYKKNFNTYLGEFRIIEACKRLLDRQYSHLTIEAIAASLGFKSRSNFVSVFKKVTGLSPSEYKKMGGR